LAPVGDGSEANEDAKQFVLRVDSEIAKAGKVNLLAQAARSAAGMGWDRGRNGSRPSLAFEARRIATVRSFAIQRAITPQILGHVPE
jgi:hypothetical protein